MHLQLCAEKSNMTWQTLVHCSIDPAYFPHQILSWRNIYMQESLMNCKSPVEDKTKEASGIFGWWLSLPSSEAALHADPKSLTELYMGRRVAQAVLKSKRTNGGVRGSSSVPLVRGILPCCVIQSRCHQRCLSLKQSKPEAWRQEGKGSSKGEGIRTEVSDSPVTNLWACMYY